MYHQSILFFTLCNQLALIRYTNDNTLYEYYNKLLTMNIIINLYLIYQKICQVRLKMIFYPIYFINTELLIQKIFSIISPNSGLLIQGYTNYIFSYGLQSSHIYHTLIFTTWIIIYILTIINLCQGIVIQANRIFY